MLTFNSRITPIINMSDDEKTIKFLTKRIIILKAHVMRLTEYRDNAVNALGNYMGECGYLQGTLMKHGIDFECRTPKEIQDKRRECEGCEE